MEERLPRVIQKSIDQRRHLLRHAIVEGSIELLMESIGVVERADRSLNLLQFLKELRLNMFHVNPRRVKARLERAEPMVMGSKLIGKIVGGVDAQGRADLQPREAGSQGLNAMLNGGDACGQVSTYSARESHFVARALTSCARGTR